MSEEAAVRATKAVGQYADMIAALFWASLFAALGGVVRSMQAGRCGFKAVSVAAISAAFCGVLVHLLLEQTMLPMSLKAAAVGMSGYASGELLKIFMVRACRWAERVNPPEK
jgi:hypothetical protein